MSKDPAFLFEDWEGTDGLCRHSTAAKEREGIYVIFDLEQIFYVGKSDNLKQRLKAHPVYRILLALDFNPCIKWKYCGNSDKQERHLIKYYNPVINFQYNGS